MRSMDRSIFVHYHRTGNAGQSGGVSLTSDNRREQRLEKTLEGIGHTSATLL